MSKVSVVINAFNEEKNLPRVITSVRSLADEIVVVDMESEDKTAEVAGNLGAKVYSHKNVGYVEPARNFAIGKATGEWVLILDADEEIGPDLKKNLKNILKNPKADFYRIPRKNIIFGKWIKHTLWWPDYQIRIFKKGFVSWSDEIHKVPITQGKGADLTAKEEFSIIHNNYVSIDDYLERMIRYTKVQAESLLKNGYVFKWQDLIQKPLGEFLSRYFEGEGYKDGIHGLALSLLQSFSELVVYIRVWEKQGFKDEDIKSKDVRIHLRNGMREINWWIVRKLTWLKFLKSR